MTGETHSVTVRRIFAASCDRVFDAFGRRESLARWFSPDRGIAVEILTFDFSPGGAFRFRFSYPNGDTSTLRGIYRSITPPRELAFSWEWEEPDRHAGLSTEVGILFLPRDSGTEVIVTHDRLHDGPAEGRYTEGWTAQLTRLGDFLSDTGGLPAAQPTSDQEENRDDRSAT